MNSNVTSNFYILLLLLWIASALTSSEQNQTKTDGSLLIANHANSTLLINSTTTESNNVTKTASKSVTESTIMGEGGPISVTTPIHLPYNIPHSPNNPDPLNSDENASGDKNNYYTTGRNSSTSKIVPRKGADMDSMIPSDKIPIENNTKPIMEASVYPTHITQSETIVDKTVTSKTDIGNVTESITRLTNITVNHTSGTEKNIENVTKTSTTVKTHKPKPTVTVGGSEAEGPMPVSSKNSPLGMPRKIDYIVPVVITIIALPLLGAATYIVYKRGRDCWDKRHYRRMDFLIDGMYND